MGSYSKINYFLRPSKQVERKLIISALQKLAKAGFFIHDYMYLGMGSIYYVDFIMFHKYLHIDEMLCVEDDDIPKRMKFNNPYDFIKVKIDKIGNVFSTLKRNKKYLVWIDYDYSLDGDILSDIRSLISVLPENSIFLVSLCNDINKLVDSLLDPVEIKDLSTEEKKLKVIPILNQLIGGQYGKDISTKDLSVSIMAKIISQTFKNLIQTTLQNKGNNKYFQLFNYRYKDNTDMITFGGIIGNQDIENIIKSIDINSFPILFSSDDPLQIEFPPLTLREKQWIEANIDRLNRHYKKSQDNPKWMKFEIEAKDVKNFIKYYRYYPYYFESIA
jgi:hypothetical protein